MKLKSSPPLFYIYIRHQIEHPTPLNKMLKTPLFILLYSPFAGEFKDPNS